MNEITPMEDLQTYEAQITASIQSNSRLPIPNTGLAKALIIINQIIKHSSNNVAIFCKELSGDVYASLPIREAIKHALLRSVRFEIFLQSEHPAETSLPLLKLFEKFASKNQVTIKTLHNSEKYSKALQNFCMVDCKLIRIETERKNRKGDFFANNPWLVEKLSKTLQRMREVAQPL